MRRLRLILRLFPGRLRLFVIMATSLAGLAAHSSAAAFYTLATNGPSSNRLCLVFLSEGYTSAQANTFLADCTNAMKVFFSGGGFPSDPAFVEYSNYFNAYAIFTNSVNAGSDHPAQIPAVFKDTVFNSAYDATYDYVITIPPGATGQGRVDALLNSYTPTNAFRYRLPVLLVNDSSQNGEAGGSGGATVIVGTGFNSEGILVHETGHGLAGLGDEYEADPGGFDFSSLPSEPNTTTNTAFNLIPWKLWIDTNSTPIPTPASGYENSVGLFQGAHYSTTNWYRPKLNCRMRSVVSSIDIPFCEVCREALVKMYYSKIRAIDAVTPTNASITLTSTQAVAFSVTPLQPLTHSLSLQWRTNGINITGATNTTFQLAARAGLTNLSVVARDNTDWVRNDPGNLMATTNTWALTSLWLEAPQGLAGGKFRFTVRGSGLTNFTIKASTNLTAWASIATNALNGGAFSFTNSGLTNTPWRYYRAVSPPQ